MDHCSVTTTCPQHGEAQRSSQRPGRPKLSQNLHGKADVGAVGTRPPSEGSVRAASSRCSEGRGTSARLHTALAAQCRSREAPGHPRCVSHPQRKLWGYSQDRSLPCSALPSPLRCSHSITSHLTRGTTTPCKAPQSTAKPRHPPAFRLLPPVSVLTDALVHVCIAKAEVSQWTRW